MDPRSDARVAVEEHNAAIERMRLRIADKMMQIRALVGNTL